MTRVILWQMFDVDGSGKLEAGEFQHALPMMGENVSPDQVAQRGREPRGLEDSVNPFPR